MQGDYHGQPMKTGIANVQDTRYPAADFLLPAAEVDIPQRPYNRHKLYGLNVFLNAFVQQFPLLLGYRQQDFMNGNVKAPLLTRPRVRAGGGGRETAAVGPRARGAGRPGAGGGGDGEEPRRPPPAERRGLPPAVRRAGWCSTAQGSRCGPPGRTNEIGVLLKGTTQQAAADRVLAAGAGRAAVPAAPPGDHRPGAGADLRGGDPERLAGVHLELPAPLLGDQGQPAAAAGVHAYAGAGPGQRQEYGDATRPGQGPEQHWWPKPAKPERYRNPKFPGHRALQGHEGRSGLHAGEHPAGAARERTRWSTGSRLSAEQRAAAKQVRVTLYSQSAPPHYLKERFEYAAQQGASAGPPPSSTTWRATSTRTRRARRRAVPLGLQAEGGPERGARGAQALSLRRAAGAQIRPLRVSEVHGAHLGNPREGQVRSAPMFRAPLLLMLLMTTATTAPSDTPAWTEQQAAQILEKTQTIQIAPDLSTLTPGERTALSKLLEVGQLFQDLYEDSRHRQALELRKRLEGQKGPLAEQQRQFYALFQGPIATTLGNSACRSFPSIRRRPARTSTRGASPQEEIERVLAAHPEDRGPPAAIRARWCAGPTAADAAARPGRAGAPPGARHPAPGLCAGAWALPPAGPGELLRGALRGRLRRRDGDGLRTALEAAEAVEGDDAELAGYLRNRARDLLANDYECGRRRLGHAAGSSGSTRRSAPTRPTTTSSSAPRRSTR